MLDFAHHATSAKLDEIPTLPDRRWHHSPCRSCNHRLVGQAAGHLCAIRNSRNSSGAGLALIYEHLPASEYPASAIQSLLAVGLRIPHRGGVWTCQNRRTHSFLCSRIKFFRARICLRPRGAFRVGYGLFGLLWVLSRRDERFRDSIDPRTVVVFVVWFFCIATTLTHTFPFPRATNARCSPPKKFSPQIKCYFRARAAYRKQCTVWSFTRPVACMKA